MAWSEWQNVVGDAKLVLVHCGLGVNGTRTMQCEEELVFVRTNGNNGMAVAEIGLDVIDCEKESLVYEGIDGGYGVITIRRAVYRLTGAIGSSYSIYTNPTGNNANIVVIGIQRE